MKTARDFRMWFVVLLFALASFFVWSDASPDEGSEGLTVAFLDVGQGDAIYIESPTGTELLIDTGRDSRVLQGLAEMMGPFDRTLDTLLLTHPDADHIGGVPAILEHYEVKTVIDSGTTNDTNTYEQSEYRRSLEGSADVVAERGMVLDLGGDAFLTILFPDRALRGEGDNDSSVVARLDYGDTSFLFTGDAGVGVEEYLVNLDPELLDVDILKLGHHGSRTSSSARFLRVVSPEVAVISAGCSNQYGHPHEEVLERLKLFNIETRSTCEEGSVVYEFK